MWIPKFNPLLTHKREIRVGLGKKGLSLYDWVSTLNRYDHVVNPEGHESVNADTDVLASRAAARFNSNYLSYDFLSKEIVVGEPLANTWLLASPDYRHTAGHYPDRRDAPILPAFLRHHTKHDSLVYGSVTTLDAKTIYFPKATFESDPYSIIEYWSDIAEAHGFNPKYARTYVGPQPWPLASSFDDFLSHSCSGITFAAYSSGVCAIMTFDPVYCQSKGGMTVGYAGPNKDVFKTVCSTWVMKPSGGNMVMEGFASWVYMKHGPELAGQMTPSIPRSYINYEGNASVFDETLKTSKYGADPTLPISGHVNFMNGIIDERFSGIPKGLNFRIKDDELIGWIPMGEIIDVILSRSHTLEDDEVTKLEELRDAVDIVCFQYIPNGRKLNPVDLVSKSASLSEMDDPLGMELTDGYTMADAVKFIKRLPAQTIFTYPVKFAPDANKKIVFADNGGLILQAYDELGEEMSPDDVFSALLSGSFFNVSKDATAAFEATGDGTKLERTLQNYMPVFKMKMDTCPRDGDFFHEDTDPLVVLNAKASDDALSLDRLVLTFLNDSLTTNNPANTLNVDPDTYRILGE